MPRKARDVRTALLQKGFAEEKRDHCFYFLHYAGKKSSINTKMSHGMMDGDISEGLPESVPGPTSMRLRIRKTAMVFARLKTLLATLIARRQPREDFWQLSDGTVDLGYDKNAIMRHGFFYQDRNGVFRVVRTD